MYHFERVLSNGADGGLNDTQRMLSHMLLANCGLLLASRSLKKMEEMEDSLYDEELVERYRGEILLQRAETFVRALYHIVTPEGSEIVSEERYFAEQDDCHPDEVRLLIENHYDGLVVCYGCKCVILNYATFYLLLYSERLLARGHP